MAPEQNLTKTNSSKLPSKNSVTKLPPWKNQAERLLTLKRLDTETVGHPPRGITPAEAQGAIDHIAATPIAPCTPAHANRLLTQLMGQLTVEPPRTWPLYVYKSFTGPLLRIHVETAK